MNHHAVALFRYLFRWLIRAEGRFTELENRMTELSADQAHEDADVAALNQSFDAIEAEVAALKQAQRNGQPIDFTGLDNLVSRAKGDEPAPAPEPAPTPEPAPAPDQPPAQPTDPNAPPTA